jgi:hypothetical protein
MIQTTTKPCIILWQECAEDAVPEPVLILEKYLDVLIITQEENCININYESISELIKALKSINK